MSKNGDPKSPSSGESARDLLRCWLSSGKSWPSFLNSHDARQRLTRIVRDRLSSDTGCDKGSAAELNYLERCCEEILDAHTIEDAIFWHCEVIGELAVKMHELQTKGWPPAVKTRMIAEVEERIGYHSRLVNRLTGVIQRKEQLVWRR